MTAPRTDFPITGKIAAKSFQTLESSRNLPKGWRWVKLGEVCEAFTGVRDPRMEPEKEFHYVDISSVDSVRKLIVEAKTLLGINAPSRARQVICENDVLVATTRPNLNAVAIVPEELNNQICSTGFCILRATEQLDPHFLFAFVRHESFVAALSDLVKGALYPAVNDKQVKAQLIPLPPLAEQKRIAAILNEQMAAVERARKAAEEQSNAAELYPFALVRESLKKSRPRRMSLGDCLDEVRGGIGPEWAKYPGLGATRQGLALAKDPVGKMPERYKPVTCGTVFYNPMRILLGSIAMVDESDTPGITSPDYVVVRGKDGILDSRWFYYWFRSPFGAHLIESLSRGAVRERILFNRLAEGIIKIPPIDVQKEASDKMRHIAGARRTVDDEIQTINRLPAALLRRAFNGEL